MRIFSLALAAASAAAICAASPAMAQSANNDVNGTTGYDAQAQMADQSGDSDHGWHGMRDSDWHHWDHRRGNCNWRHENMMRWRRPEWMMGGPDSMMRGGRMRAWSRPRGAHFLFKHGKSRVDIQCPARANLDDCVNAADKVLNRLAALKRAAAAFTSAHPANPAGANGAVPATPGAAPATKPGGATKP
jgi:hypothetical protein